MKNTNIKKLFAITIFTLLGIFSLSLYAQENKSDLEAKLKQINGKIDKITFTVDGKDVVFEGKEAEKLGKGIKLFSKADGPVWISEDGNNSDVDGENVIMFKHKGRKLNWRAKDSNQKNVEVTIEDGKKKVTVTTMKDGKEETKVFEGAEAEKFLKDEEQGNNVFVIKVGDKDSIDWKVKEDGEKKVKVTIEDGKKKVTVTTMNDGKEETKVYEGDEADKFIADEGNGKKIKVIVKGEGDDEDHMIYLNSSSDDDCCCCCKKMKHKMMMPVHEKGMKKIIIEKKIDKDLKEEKADKK